MNRHTGSKRKFDFKKSARNSSFMVALTILLGFLGANQEAFGQTSGKDLFQQRCFACHSIGQGKRVGPDLAGVTDRRPEEWLIKFVKSSQALVNSGDATAKAIFEEFNKMVMPDQALSNEEIKGILGYIKEASGGAPGGEVAAQTPPPVEVEATQDEIDQGSYLFQGKLRFSNGGPSCIACHHVKNDAIIAGGILAKELTAVFSRVGGDGVRAILGSAPFPVMQAAYKNKPFTEEEIRYLMAFLKNADKQQMYQQPINYGWRMLAAGCGGVVLLFGFFSLVGCQRKRQSVNQAIYDRQIKSE